jgi:hypothetical protein
VIQIGTHHKEYAVSLAGTFGDKPSLRRVEGIPVKADIRVQTQYMGACSPCHDGIPKSVIGRRHERGPYRGQVPSTYKVRTKYIHEVVETQFPTHIDNMF